jgi:YHS domain-containing protein
MGAGRIRRIPFSVFTRSTIMTGTTIDPVCGMNVDPQDAAGESEYQGQIFYFCCKDCKRMFDEDPTNYVSEQTAEYATKS